MYYSVTSRKGGGNVKKTLLYASLLLATVSSSVAIIGTWFGSQSAANSEKPNIVFVLTDDMRKDDLRFVPKTRRLVGRRGMEFENAFVTFARCCPSRASILTGLYPHNHRVFTNEAPEGGEPGFRPKDGSTVATWLDGAGYRTALFGKYFNHYAGVYRPPGWDVWHANESDEMTARRAKLFIRTSAHKPAPFFAYVAPHTPHPPAKPPARYADRYPNLRVPRTRDYNEKNVSDKPHWIRTLDRLSQKEKDAADKLYRNRARSLLEIDDMMERLVTTLRETGELNNTYIIFTSDNGFHFAEHRLQPPRKTTAYEPDIRIPLLVRGPGIAAGTHRSQMVLNNDFGVTMADLGGARPTRKVDGRSFVPILRGHKPAWRSAFLVENPTSSVVPAFRTIRKSDGKKMTQFYNKGVREIYRLSKDPRELKNVQRTVPEGVKQRLQHRLNALKDCFGFSCRTAEGP
jgi:N-acetylglucosamine-6-sulfatase